MKLLELRAKRNLTRGDEVLGSLLIEQSILYTKTCFGVRSRTVRRSADHVGCRWIVSGAVVDAGIGERELLDDDELEEFPGFFGERTQHEDDAVSAADATTAAAKELVDGFDSVDFRGVGGEGGCIVEEKIVLCFETDVPEERKVGRVGGAEEGYTRVGGEACEEGRGGCFAQIGGVDSVEDYRDWVGRRGAGEVIEDEVEEDAGLIG